MHDFMDQQLGKAIPYGVYDLGANTGWVTRRGRPRDLPVRGQHAALVVGRRRRSAYLDTTRLLITADSGGANGNRRRAWKTELAALAAETGLQISVCHLPPGTSKWNKIEHRLFSQITRNWRSRPLTSHETIINLIGATTTTTGLTVTAQLDTAAYPTGVKVTDREMKQLPITRDSWHGEWNYTSPNTRHARPALT